MPCDQRFVVLSLESKRHHRGQAGIAEDQDGIVASEVDLFEDFVGGGERFGENREFVGNRIGKWDQICIRKAEVIRECAIAGENSQHGPIDAMTPETDATEGASPARSIYLTDYAPDAEVW